MSQLDLALASGVSARHLSFLETGRALPSREMVLTLAEALLLPLGVRNALLAAAGFAPSYPASDLTSEALAPFHAALSEIIDRHHPFPALVCDRYWTIRDANASARLLLSALHGDGGQMNIVRMLTDAPEAEDLVVNYAEVIAEMTARIRLEALEAGADETFDGLIAALETAAARRPYGADVARRPLAPVVLNAPGGELLLLSTIAHFGTSEDVTVRDLRLELLFPADDATRDALLALA